MEERTYLSGTSLAGMSPTRSRVENDYYAIYENDTKPILSDPPYLLQFILSVVLSVLCGATIMFMWNWFVVPLGLPMIGLVQALGLDTLITFIVTTRVNTNPDPFWDRWITAITYALLTLFGGWLLHFFM